MLDVSGLHSRRSHSKWIITVYDLRSLRNNILSVCKSFSIRHDGIKCRIHWLQPCFLRRPSSAEQLSTLCPSDCPENCPACTLQSRPATGTYSQSSQLHHPGRLCWNGCQCRSMASGLALKQKQFFKRHDTSVNKFRKCTSSAMQLLWHIGCMTIFTCQTPWGHIACAVHIAVTRVDVWQGWRDLVRWSNTRGLLRHSYTQSVEINFVR